MKKKSSSNFVRTTWRTDEKTYKKIEMLAAENDRTINKEIDRIIKRYIELYEADHGALTKEKD